MVDVVPSAGFIDVRYGPDAHMRYDVARHPIRDPGGNPWILWRHGGGWGSNDKRQPFTRAQRGNALFAYLLNNKTGKDDAHFDCISYNTRQASWTAPTALRVNVPTNGSTVGASWVASTNTLTAATGTFTNYVFRAGDVFVASGGAGVTPGTYPIASRTSATVIVLANNTLSGSDLGAVVIGQVVSALGAAVTGWYDDVDTYPSYFPDTFMDTKRCIQHVKSTSMMAGRDMNKGIISGSSAGAVMAFWSQATAPLFNDRPGIDQRNTRYSDMGGANSRCAGVLAHILPIDFRRGSLTVSGCTWTVGTLTITAPSGTPWASTKYVTTNGTRAIVTGPGVTTGEYVVSSATNTTLVLTGAIAAGNLGAVVTVTLPNEVESVLESAWRALFGTNALTETWALPDDARNAVSLLSYVEHGKDGCQWMPPMHLTYETASSTDVKPYPTGHEGIQLTTLLNTARRVGLSDLFSGEVVGSWADTAQAAADTSSESVYRFMKQCVTNQSAAPSGYQRSVVQ